jgi:hypothetical protein
MRDLRKSWVRTDGSRRLNNPAALTKKPDLKQFEVWGACPRCAFRVAQKSLKLEKMTGLKVCPACWDPYHPSLDFQVKADRSIEPPAYPLPPRWGGVTAGPKDPWDVGYPPSLRHSYGGAVDMLSRTNFYTPNKTNALYPNAFGLRDRQLTDTRFVADAPRPIGYDGVFIPSGVSADRVNVPPATPNVDMQNLAAGIHEHAPKVGES